MADNSDPYAQFATQTQPANDDPYAAFTAPKSRDWAGLAGAPQDTQQNDPTDMSKWQNWERTFAPRPQPQKDVVDSFFANTSAGRVMDAFGMGAKDGWGTMPTDARELSPTQKKLVEGGLATDPNDPKHPLSFIRAFGDGVLRPLAGYFDVANAGFNAALSGAGVATGQLMNETGVTKALGNTEDSSRRDWEGMFQLAPMAGGAEGGHGAEAPRAAGEPGPVATMPPETYNQAQSLGVLNDVSELHDPRPVDETHGPKNFDPAPPGPVASDPFPVAQQKTAAMAAERPPQIYAPLPSEDLAGNIRLENINKPEDVKQVFRDAAAANNDFTAARRGVQSDAQREFEARMLGQDPATFKPRNEDDIPWSVRAQYVRNMAQQAAEEVAAAKTKAKSGNEDDVFAYAQAATRAQMIIDELSHVTAESGRTQRVFMKDKGAAGVDVKSVADILKDSTGRTQEEWAEHARNAPDPLSTEQAMRQANDMRKPTYGDMANEYYVNNLLTGTDTHSSYAEGNWAGQIIQGAIDHPIANLIGKAKDVLGFQTDSGKIAKYEKSIADLQAKTQDVTLSESKRAKAAGDLADQQQQLAAYKALGTDRVYFPEVYRGLQAFFGSHEEAAIAFGRAMKKGNAEALPGEANVAPNSYGNIGKAIPGTLGKIIRAPSERMVAPVHTFTRVMGYRFNMAQLAFNQAAREGLRGEDMTLRAAQLASDPDPVAMSIAKAAQEMGEGDKVTDKDIFLKMSLAEQARAESSAQALMGGKGELADKISELKNSNNPAVSFMFRWLFPFVRVVSQQTKRALLERTPLGLFNDEIRDNLMGRNGGRAQDIQIARNITGAGLATVAVGLWGRGRLTGPYPSDPAQQRQWKLENKQEWSVNIGGRWVSYKWLGAPGLLLAMTADTVQNWHDAEASDEDIMSGIGSLIAGWGHTMLDTSFMRSFSSLVDAVTNWKEKGQQFLDNAIPTAVSPVSVGGGQIARDIDPYKRDVRNMGDAELSHIPFASELIPAKRDIFGQKVPNEGNLLPVFSNAKVQTATTDPVKMELDRLGIYPASPERTINHVKLDAGQYDFYQYARGVLLHQGLQREFAKPDWYQRKPEDQITAVEKIRAAATRGADRVMKMRYGDIAHGGVAFRQKQVNGVQPVAAVEK